MANRTCVISFRQIENFKPSTTARWLTDYLHSDEGEANNIDNFLALVRLVQFIYNFFPTLNKTIDPMDYRDDMIRIYRVRSWSPYMMASFLELKGIFLPREWVLLWRHYNQLTKEEIEEEFTDQQRQLFETLNQLGAKMFAKYGQWTPGVDTDPEENKCRQ